MGNIPKLTSIATSNFHQNQHLTPAINAKLTSFITASLFVQMFLSTCLMFFCWLKVFGWLFYVRQISKWQWSEIEESVSPRPMSKRQELRRKMANDEPAKPRSQRASKQPLRRPVSRGVTRRDSAIPFEILILRFHWSKVQSYVTLWLFGGKRQVDTGF